MMFDQEQLDELRKYAYSVYILQALGFLTVITPVIGVIINHVKDEDVRGSWLESHFRWQKATFWYGLLWIILGTFTAWVGIGFVVLWLIPFWFIYRIARGWIYLVDGKEMYPQTAGDNDD